jgi:hypothetical protein
VSPFSKDVGALLIFIYLCFIYLLTAIGLMPDGSVTKIGRTYKKWTYIARKQNIQLTKNSKDVGAHSRTETLDVVMAASSSAKEPILFSYLSFEPDSRNSLAVFILPFYRVASSVFV